MKKQQTFAEGIMEHQATWYRIAYGIVHRQVDAEEIVCESIVKAYEKQGQMKKIGSFKSWMTSIVLHTAYDYVRKNKEILADSTELPYEMLTSPSVEHLHLKQETKHYVLEQIQQLDEAFQMVLILYYYEEFSTKEIAKLLNISTGTVKSRLSRGRKYLYDLLKKEDVTYEAI